MKKKAGTSVAERMKLVQDIIPAADAMRFFNQLLEVRREQAATARDIAKIDAAREIALTEIRNKYELLHMVFDRVFDERADAISKHFQIIDKGLAANDRDLVLGGLKGLSDIVASSPFGSVEQLGRMLESNQRIEI